MKFVKPFYLFVFFSGIFIQSCQVETSELSKSFSCTNINKLSNFESITDFNKNFSIQVPKHWNTKLYYDSVQSEIFTADTIKSLTETYIMDFSVITNDLKINEDFKTKVREKIEVSGMKVIDEKFYTFKNNKAFYNLSFGNSKGKDLHIFQTYIKINEYKYMLIKTEFYGKEGFDSRLCESISIINKVNINK